MLEQKSPAEVTGPWPTKPKPSGHPVGLRGVWYSVSVVGSVMSQAHFFHSFFFCSLIANISYFISALFFWPRLSRPLFHLFFNYFCGRWCVCFIYLVGFFKYFFSLEIKHACCRQRCSFGCRPRFVCTFCFYSTEIPLAQLSSVSDFLA